MPRGGPVEALGNRFASCLTRGLTSIGTARCVRTRAEDVTICPETARRPGCETSHDRDGIAPARDPCARTRHARRLRVRPAGTTILAAVCASLIGAPLRAQQPGPGIDGEVRDRIRTRLEGPAPTAGGETLRAPGLVRRFYEGRDYVPAWSRAGRVRREAAGLLDFIDQAVFDGLRPRTYHEAPARRLLERWRAAEAAVTASAMPSGLAELDLFLSDAFLAYGGHLLVGVLDPVTLEPRRLEATEDIDLPTKLEAAIDDHRVAAGLASLVLTAEPGHLRLREGLARYRKIAERGGWPAPLDDGGPGLRAGHSGPAVKQLRARLAMTGDYEPPELAAGVDSPGNELESEFDSALAAAVRAFQRRHGLPDDGVVDDRTRRALNVPADRRVRQIELNLERGRWLPHDLGPRYLMVNSAGFEVRVVEGDSLVRRLRAVVGSRFTPTPVFADTVSYLVLNPTWRVPADIAAEEILPRVAVDPQFLRRGGYRLVGPSGRALDPAAIDWGEFDDLERVPFRVEQIPGPGNALGRVKFMFPNPYNVYLHDTPETRLFAETSRARSHGCIRIENALWLAELLLTRDERWTTERIAEGLAAREETTIGLRHRLPIYVEYWTAWAARDGSIHFREDVYGRDDALDRALP